MILINVTAAAKNPYLEDINAVLQCSASACIDAFGVTEKDVVFVCQSAGGNLGNMLIFNVTLPKPFSAGEKQQFITFLSKNLGSQLNVKMRELAVTLNEPQKENLGGVWSIK